MTETLILVNCNNKPQGTGEKMDVHLKGLRHRAFSVMIFNKRGELLIQKRADCKYHSAGLWANSCCGHPRPNEDVKDAAKRRTFEELGFSCELEPVTEISYTLELENDLHENEYTHVFKGVYDGEMDLNPEEVSEIAWESPKEILMDALNNKSQYARWFRLYLFKHFNEVFPQPHQRLSM